MDSEKVIIEIIEPLLKDYLAFTRGRVPKDWVNVKDERQADIERLQREINDLKESIKKAEEFNEDIEKAMPSLKVRKPGMVDELEADIKENKEKIETDQKKIEVLEGGLDRTQEELAQANAQIERRRQAKIAKIKHEIRDTIRQEIEAKEATGVEQEKLETLRKYEELSDDDIKNLAIIVEKQEENELRASKIEKLKLGLERKEKNCQDLLTGDYYSTKEEYIKNLEEVSIEELEQIKSITIGTIYLQVAKRVMAEQDKDKAKSVFDTVGKIANREEIIKQNELVAGESKLQGAKYVGENESQSQEKNTFLSMAQKGIEGIKNIPNRIAKIGNAMRNIGIRFVNWSFGMKLLGDGKEGVLIDDEQIHERWQKNKEKHEQLMKKISQKRETKQLIEEQSSMLQKEMSKENREESIQEELQEQLKVAQAENDIEEVDYLTRMMQAVSQVTVKTDEERKKEWEAYRRANHIEDKTTHTQEENEFVAMRQINKPLIIPQFIKDYGAKKSKEESLDTRISEEKPRRNTWIKRFFKKAENEKTPAAIPNSSNQSINSYTQGLKAGSPSQEEQSEHARTFQQNVDENKKEIKMSEVILGGE